ncbi:LIM/homeobox protein Lhx2 isoform X1 [Procambarus clarkii]|uniref:LIM/homeobox protein Lhx2 isoform X1 n=1 Tax=Procambarus clarkii TaxID=6728 RepID=UPI003742D129
MLDRQEESQQGQEEVVCVGCGGRITERWFSKTQEGVWHSACLRCWECHQPLEEKCFAKHGHLYCRDDYFRIFGCGRCGRCGLDISPQELVMRARHHVFHLHCFTCASCHVQLHKGDHFGMRDGAVYCRPHYELILQSEAEMEAVGVSAGMSYPPLSPATPRLAFYNGVGAAQKGRPRKRKLPTEDLPPLTPLTPGMELVPSGELTMDGYRYDHQAPNQNRTKRMRTSFKHHQLRTMKSYFNLNQNPDAKDLKQLAQKTGLSKRVLQVWFQNARAKWRRNILKQEHERHVGDKMKEQSGLLADLRPVDSLGPGLTDLYAMSSGDEGSQSLQFTDMCQ